MNVVSLRTEFVYRALQEDVPFVVLCREFGVSTKTGYKWKARFMKDGLRGLDDQSRKPASSPQQVGEDQVCEYIRLKVAHRRWGPKKIRELFVRHHPTTAPASLSTVKRVLQKAGLVESRRRRRAQECGRLETQVAVDEPNTLWTVDFKGWWYSAEHERVEPLTVRDAFSRYILCVQVLPDARTETVRRCFEDLFQTYGLPGTIRSDNGAPFASRSAPLGLSRLSAWWVALGINLDRIAPGHPEQNGGHERMHRDIAQEVEGALEGDHGNDAVALSMWCREFNYERPHEALGLHVPAELYRKSARRFDPSPAELTYPAGYERRLVTTAGSVTLHTRCIRISEAIRGWHVGLQQVGAHVYAVWFGPLHLGEIELETESFRAATSCQAQPESAVASETPCRQAAGA
jgi:transposase InsO family protein